MADARADFMAASEDAVNAPHKECPYCHVWRGSLVDWITHASEECQGES